MQELCASTHIIAVFNIIVGLKPKGKKDQLLGVQVVLLLKVVLDLPKSSPRGYHVKVVTRILVDLKYDDRDIIESSFVFLCSKDKGAGR